MNLDKKRSPSLSDSSESGRARVFLFTRFPRLAPYRAQNGVFSQISLGLLNKHMPKQGRRPHIWKVQGEIPHQQYCAWLQARAQANYRGEVFLLAFEDFQLLWAGYWDRKGRGRDDFCLTREDPEGAWERSNCQIIPRLEQLRRQKFIKVKRNGKKNLSTETG